jgi:hypothetical protein
MSIVGNLPRRSGGPHPIVRTSELEESQVPTMTEERIAGLTRVQRSRERETNRPEESSLKRVAEPQKVVCRQNAGNEGAHDTSKSHGVSGAVA